MVIDALSPKTWYSTLYLETLQYLVKI